MHFSKIYIGAAKHLQNFTFATNASQLHVKSEHDYIAHNQPN